MLRGSPAVESFLLKTAPAGLLPKTVIEHVRERIFERPSQKLHVFEPISGTAVLQWCFVLKVVFYS